MVSQSLLVGTFQPCWHRLLSKEAVFDSFCFIHGTTACAGIFQVKMMQLPWCSHLQPLQRSDLLVAADMAGVAPQAPCRPRGRWGQLFVEVSRCCSLTPVPHASDFTRHADGPSTVCGFFRGSRGENSRHNCESQIPHWPHVIDHYFFGNWFQFQHMILWAFVWLSRWKL